MSDIPKPDEYLKIKYSAPPEACKCGNCQLVPPGTLIHWHSELDRARRGLLVLAASHQGGHSDTGRIAANMLGIHFPIRMEALIAKAREWGYRPAELWPWSELAREKPAVVSLV